MTIDATDRRIHQATASGLPLTARPFAEVSRWLGLPEAEVMARLARMQADGIIRRIALCADRHALGQVANGMSVWDVADDRVRDLGRQVAALPFVGQCCLRPRRLPGWPYNLFAKLGGESRDEVEEQRSAVAALLGPACRGHDILFSTRVLKKTGMRLAGEG